MLWCLITSINKQLISISLWANPHPVHIYILTFNCPQDFQEFKQTAKLTILDKTDIESEVIATWLVESKLQNNYQRTSDQRNIPWNLYTVHTWYCILKKNFPVCHYFQIECSIFPNGFNLRSTLSGFLNILLHECSYDNDRKNVMNSPC